MATLQNFNGGTEMDLKRIQFYRWMVIILIAVIAPGCAILGGETVEEDETSRGLKEALHIGTGNAVETVSRKDGYYRNPVIRILLPESVQKVEKVLRIAGFGPKVDEFDLSMNRAAERAAPKAKSLFWEAIKKIRFADVWNILSGRENEATLYLKDKTYTRLQAAFKPIVHNAMSEVGVTRSYQDLEHTVRAIPFTDMLSFDLDQYVTDKALDGLFHMLAEEEARIRKDPVARVTALLKKVFGNN